MPPLYAETRPLYEETDDIDITTSATQHFGPAPVGRVDRRTHNARRIKQTATLDDNGIFSVDMPIPTRLAQFLPVKGVEEQKTTRYTAITTKPDDVPASGFRLRQNVCGRSTEMLITITMYNENAELFCRTLWGVMRNIAHLCQRKNSRVWGQDGWKKVRLPSEQADVDRGVHSSGWAKTCGSAGTGLPVGTRSVPGGSHDQ